MMNSGAGEEATMDTREQQEAAWLTAWRTWTTADGAVALAAARRAPITPDMVRPAR